MNFGMSGMERERERSISIWGGNESLRGGGGGATMWAEEVWRDRASETGSRSGCVMGRPEKALAGEGGANKGRWVG